MRLFFIANCMYGPHVGGGDIHFLHMAQAAQTSGHNVTFIGGHALQHHLHERNISGDVWLTDKAMLPPFDASSFRGQLRLFHDYLWRFRRTQTLLSKISSEDIVYAVTDFWFDALPMMRCQATRKLMILGMIAPSWGQILTAGRQDVTPLRLPSLYYRISQSISLRRFQKQSNKHLFYVHPEMHIPLIRQGYQEKELVFISNGMDLKTIKTIPEQQKRYDVLWMGRYHRQKGIDDLILTLEQLVVKFPDFKAILIGKVKEQLQPQLEARGLLKHVEFAGFVSEIEKFKLLKASRLFLMPSHYESWGIVIAEALACETPVIAYDLSPYRPVFGELPVYVPAMDVQSFARIATTTLERLRNGEFIRTQAQFRQFAETNSWDAAGQIFVKTLQS